MTIDLNKLTKLRKKLGTNYKARVGILGGKASETHAEPVTKYDTKTGKEYRTSGTSGGMTNAELAVIHIWGSITAGIPARDFLKMPIEMKAPEIVKMLGTKEIKKLIEAGEIEKVFKLIGIKGEQIVQRAFVTSGFGQWPPLKEATIEAKGSSKPLIDSGQLRRAVSSDVVTK